MKRLATLLLLAPLAGCRLAVAPPAPLGAPTAPAPGWRAVVKDKDRIDLAQWRTRLAGALQSAPRATRDDPLYQLDAAQRGASLPPGDYRCRTIKLGNVADSLPYVVYGWFRCRIGAPAPASGVQTFAKLNGSQRQNGLLYPHDDFRSVFLGTLALGDEQGALRYGQDAERDVAGWIERIDARRWRIIIARPRFESQTDLIELIPG